MIRYVLAAMLAVALVALSIPAIERAGSMNSERQLEASLAAIDDEATALMEREEPTPAGHPDPTRVVDVTLPRNSLTTTGVDHLELAPRENGNYTHARYVFDDGTTREATIDEPIVGADPETTRSTEFGGSGEQRLALVLLTDGDGEPVVVARHA